MDHYLGKLIERWMVDEAGASLFYRLENLPFACQLHRIIHNTHTSCLHNEIRKRQSFHLLEKASNMSHRSWYDICLLVEKYGGSAVPHIPGSTRPAGALRSLSKKCSAFAACSGSYQG